MITNPVIILAGGDGVRIKSLFPNIPKPMIPFNQKPFIDSLILKLLKQKIKKIYLAVNKKNTKYFKKYNSLNVKTCIEEDKLGTGGAIKSIMESYQINTAIVLNGDSFCDVDIVQLIAYHKIKKSDLTICITKNYDERVDGGNVTINNHSNKIINFNEKNKNTFFINAGIYIVNIRTLLSCSKVFSLESFIEANVEKYNMYGFKTENPVYDFGTPERYNKYKKIISEELSKIN